MQFFFWLCPYKLQFSSHNPPASIAFWLENLRVEIVFENDSGAVAGTALKMLINTYSVLIVSATGFHVQLKTLSHVSL